MQELQSILTDATNVIESSTPEAWRIAVLQDGLDFAKLELPARRYLAKYEQDPSDENAFGLALECARVEQWMLAHPQTQGVAVQLPLLIISALLFLNGCAKRKRR